MSVFDFGNGFKTQAEMWTHLLQGGKVKSAIDGQVCELKDGNLDTYRDVTAAFTWEKYGESKWYENIPEQGILCWVSNAYPDERDEIAVVRKYTHSNAFNPVYTYSNANGAWKWAEPLTGQDAVSRIYKPA